MSEMPPCPHCAKDVDNLSVEAVDEGYTAASLTRIPYRSWIYTLVPCGHEVAGYDGDSFGRVFRWHP